jgi:hypothetical protein
MILLLFRIFVAMGRCLPSRCLATIRDTYTGIDKGFMKYVVEMGSATMIYIQSFIKIGLGIRKFYTDT